MTRSPQIAITGSGMGAQWRRQRLPAARLGSRSRSEAKGLATTLNLAAYGKPSGMACLIVENSGPRPGACPSTRNHQYRHDSCKA